MEKHEIIKIVIVTAITVVLKDVFAWLIRSTKPVAATLAKIIGNWTLRHFSAIDFALDVGFFIIWIALFLNYPGSEKEVTYMGVKMLIFLALVIILQAINMGFSLRKWLKGNAQPVEAPNERPALPK